MINSAEGRSSQGKIDDGFIKNLCGEDRVVVWCDGLEQEELSQYPGNTCDKFKLAYRACFIRFAEPKRCLKCIFYNIGMMMCIFNCIGPNKD